MTRALVAARDHEIGPDDIDGLLCLAGNRGAGILSIEVWDFETGLALAERQVKVTRESTLLFYNVNGRRQPVRSRNGDFTVGKTRFTLDELRSAIDKSPEAFSANVLLRPIIQDTLLPTAAYIGGPAEIAYMAQNQIVYKSLLGRMPAIVPRAAFTLVDPLIARILAKFDLEVRDVFRGPQFLRKKMERKFLPRPLASRFDSELIRSAICFRFSSVIA